MTMDSRSQAIRWDQRKRSNHVKESTKIWNESIIRIGTKKKNEPSKQIVS